MTKGKWELYMATLCIATVILMCAICAICLGCPTDSEKVRWISMTAAVVFLTGVTISISGTFWLKRKGKRHTIGPEIKVYRIYNKNRTTIYYIDEDGMKMAVRIKPPFQDKVTIHMPEYPYHNHVLVYTDVVEYEWKGLYISYIEDTYRVYTTEHARYGCR